MALLEIANSALAKLGSVRISALSDLSEQALLCNQQLPLIYKELLRQHSWGFALKRVALTQNGTDPVFGFGAAFDLPADCLGVLETDLPEDSEWSIEGTQLLCDESTVAIQYIIDITDTDKWTTDFKELVASKLAHDISYALTQSASLKQQLWDEFDKKLRLARSIDSRERSGQRVKATKWRNSRY